MWSRWRKFFVRENRIYIIPSIRGFIFLAVVVVMILTASTYNNNLVFLLAFFLFSIFVTSMVQTHFILQGVDLDFAGADDGFEQDPMSLHFHLRQKQSRSRRGLNLRSLSRKFIGLSHRLEELSPMELSKTVRIEVLAWGRGVHSVPEVALETYYPMGLFRAWKVFRPQGLLYVYPRPHALSPLLPSSFEFGEQELGLRSSPEGDFGELKSYREGESYHQIAWKHYARTGHLFTKVHWGQEHIHYQIPWRPEGQELEAYLSQMCQWLLVAAEENASFEMETPRGKIDGGQGPDHLRICLRALAEVETVA